MHTYDIKNTQTFTLISNPWKKMHPKKVIFQNFCMLGQTPILHVLNLKFFDFSQQFRNQRKILRCFDTYVCGENNFKV
jgi:hypothetical protein